MTEGALIVRASESEESRAPRCSRFTRCPWRAWSLALPRLLVPQRGRGRGSPGKRRQTKPPPVAVQRQMSPLPQQDPARLGTKAGLNPQPPGALAPGLTEAGRPAERSAFSSRHRQLAQVALNFLMTTTAYYSTCQPFPDPNFPPTTSRIAGRSFKQDRWICHKKDTMPPTHTRAGLGSSLTPRADEELPVLSENHPKSLRTVKSRVCCFPLVGSFPP